MKLRTVTMLAAIGQLLALLCSVYRPISRPTSKGKSLVVLSMRPAVWAFLFCFLVTGCKEKVVIRGNLVFEVWIGSASFSSFQTNSDGTVLAYGRPPDSPITVIPLLDSHGNVTAYRAEDTLDPMIDSHTLIISGTNQFDVTPKSHSVVRKCLRPKGSEVITVQFRPNEIYTRSYWNEKTKTGTTFAIRPMQTTNEFVFDCERQGEGLVRILQMEPVGDSSRK